MEVTVFLPGRKAGHLPAFKPVAEPAGISTFLITFATMFFDTNNPIIKKCADGMMYEGIGQEAEARQSFLEAWEMASNDFEKCIAAHYIARQQGSPEKKLSWDQLALQHAHQVSDERVREGYPSLYLNIAKGYEDLEDPAQAQANYLLAQSYVQYLPDDGYGKMIKAGIAQGVERTRP